MIQLVAPKHVVLDWLNAQRTYWEELSAESFKSEWHRYYAIMVGYCRLKRGLHCLFKKSSRAELYMGGMVGWNDRESLLLEHWPIYLEIVRQRKLEVIREALVVALSVPEGTPWPYRDETIFQTINPTGYLQEHAHVSENRPVSGDSSSLRKTSVRKLATSLERGKQEFDPQLVRGALDELAFTEAAVAELAIKHRLVPPAHLFFVDRKAVLREFDVSNGRISPATARLLVKQDDTVWQWSRDTGAAIGPVPNVLSQGFEEAMREWQRSHLE